MAVVLLVLVVTVVEVEVEESSETPAIGCERNTGIWTSSPSLRKTSISSIPTSPGGLRYVASMSVNVMQHQHTCAPPARVAVIQSPLKLSVSFLFSCSKKLNSTGGQRQLQSRGENAQIPLLSSTRPAFHVSLKPLVNLY